jgi:cytochrome c553
MMRFPETGGGWRAARGRQVFADRCASCHGADALGDDSGSAPALRGQNYTYLSSTLYRIGKGSRSDLDHAHVALVAALSEHDRNATADFLSTLPKPGKHHRPAP